MLRRLRRLKLSLATKCQLLFGIAAGIIILAALLVTWQRIEQLTRQQDIAAAETLAKQTLAAHAATGIAGTTGTGGTVAGDPSVSPFDDYDGLRVRRPRLVGQTAAADLTPFERKAMRRFQRRDSDAAYGEGYSTDDDRYGYLLALPARLDNRCLSCHAGPAGAGSFADADAPPLRLPLSPLTHRPDPNRPSPPPVLPAVGVRNLHPPADLTADPADAAPTDIPENAGGKALDESDPRPLLGLVSVDIPSQIRTRQRLLNRVFLITASLAAAATATVILYVILTRLILSPVRVLQDAAERVRGGDFSVRSDIATGDEFETLGETFNAMLGVLQDRNEQLRRANAGLDRKLDDLAQTNVALDESNRLKSEFLANVSHELRTPLNSIIGFADLMKEVAADAKLQRYANNIHASGSSLLDLINDLLDLAKIEAGKMEVRRESLSLGDLFESLTTLLGPVAGKRRVRVVPRVAEDVPLIATDPGKLQQVLFNLLSNAVKFSPDGGRVDLTADLEDAGSVRLTVRDGGPGIDAAHHELIFEKFRQLDAGVTRRHAGTGLGLTISRELAGLLGGRLGVESTPGHGATFWLVLPLEPRPRRDEARARAALAPSPARLTATAPSAA